MRRFTVFALSVLVCEHAVISARVDQRQTGDLNVQIDLKNLQIVGLMKGKEEYVDYDYAYDYSEMTIKPSSGTTKKPLNVTEPVVGDKDNTTAATTVSAVLDRITENSSYAETIATTTPASVSNDTSTVTNTSTPSLLPVADIISTNSNCRKGFFRNSNGSCELKLQNPSALIKMIKQKSKMNASKRLGQL